MSTASGRSISATISRILRAAAAESPCSALAISWHIYGVGEACTRPKCRFGAQGHAVEGFLIEEMAPKGHEIVIGSVRDASFGPLVMFGLGGIFVEVLKDVAFRICPACAALRIEARARAGDPLAAPRDWSPGFLRERLMAADWHVRR